MKIFTAIFLVALTGSGLAATNDVPPPPADLRAIMADFQKKMSTVKSVYMEYTQERVLKLFSEPLKTEGIMLVAQPERVRWETTAPYQTIMLGERKNMAQFEFNDGKWEKLKLGFPQALEKLMQQMSAMNQGRLDAMTNDFFVTVSNGTETVLTMSPKNETVRNMMSSIEIHLALDLSATRSVVMNEPNGDLTRITFQNEKYDVVFPAGTFDQSKPLPIADVKAAVNHAP